MINKDTGAITFGSLRLDAATTRREFLRSVPEGEVELMLEDAPHRTYRVLVADAAGERFTVSPYFNEESLVSVRLVVSDGRYGRSWDDWSTVKEEARKRHHDRWLRDACGLSSDASLPWGDVVSHFDDRAGASEILVTYRE